MHGEDDEVYMWGLRRIGHGLVLDPESGLDHERILAERQPKQVRVRATCYWNTGDKVNPRNPRTAAAVQGDDILGDTLRDQCARSPNATKNSVRVDDSRDNVL